MGDLRTNLESAQKQLHHDKADTQKLASDLEECQSRLAIADNSIESLHAQLTAAHAEKEGVEKSMSAQLEDVSKEKTEVSRRMSSNIISLGEELLEFKKKGVRLDGGMQLMETRIASLEADLLESRRNEERIANAMESMEGDHAEALANVEDEKNTAILNLEEKL